MGGTDEKYNISFTDITAKIESLQLDNYDLVVGIGSGGIVPASLIAYKLNLDLKIIKINLRDDENNPRYEEPKILEEFTIPDNVSNILLVDDVSVSGKTFAKAKELLTGYHITTLVLKGKGDIVLFSNINTCVNWPWK